MKLGLILALAPDRKSGQVVSGPLPFDVALKQFKEQVASGVGIAPDFPNLEIWTGSGGRVKKFTFRKFLSGEAAEPASSEPEPEADESSEQSSTQPASRGRRGGK